ncbi:MAG TPA: helix-turn-helix domain-containing protein, partial [Candidatus Micrarchaeota archaeon]|nr:helix-turn-helix domain-containing protein [Candidatus Micrarchaeota archaeon]
MDPKSLEEFGLTAAESKVYIALLEAGQSKSGAIIGATGLQSSTVYGALSSLISKGLASYAVVGKVKHYQAAPPDAFALFLDEKKARFSDLAPKLRAMESKSSLEQKSAKVFLGIKGLKSAFNDIYMAMEPGEDYCFFQMGAESLSQKQVSLFFRQWHTRRSEKGVNVRGLSTLAAKPAVKKIFEGLKHSRLRYVREFLPTGTVVYKNKILIVDFSG